MVFTHFQPTSEAMEPGKVNCATIVHLAGCAPGNLMASYPFGPGKIPKPVQFETPLKTAQKPGKFSSKQDPKQDVQVMYRQAISQ